MDIALESRASIKKITFDLPQKDGSVSIAEEIAKVEKPLQAADKKRTIEKIKTLLKAHNGVLIAHYYTDPEIQQLAEETGGCVADSLEMARFGRDSDAEVLIVAGVRFMGETAKILSPNKKVLMADLEATCSLDLGCPASEFSEFCDAYPDRTVVVYANTSAEVKARADWVVTSAIGLEIVQSLHEKGEKIIWGPDRHLGHYIQSKTGADMLLWQGSCLVHDEFKASSLEIYRQQHPAAKVLAHPESPAAVLSQADVIGSTSQLIKAAVEAAETELIVATDRGIFYKMQQAVPDKTLLIAPTAGESATCKSCALCPWMAMNTLSKLAVALETGAGEVLVDREITLKAQTGIHKMLDFAEAAKINIRASGNLEADQVLFQHVGPA